MSEISNEDFCAIFVDMGTSNTRVWFMRGNDILSRAAKAIGVRHTAQDKSAIRIESGLKELITEVVVQAGQSIGSCTPRCVGAVGMISSPLGLRELPHVCTPAGPEELTASSRWFEFPEIAEFPFLLVPGVRSGSAALGLNSLDRADVMRGEETLCLGLSALGLLKLPGLVLNLGSHWKAIEIDAQGRIIRSISSLAGELINAAKTHTILASSVSRHWPSRLTRQWLEAGMNEQRRSGLTRALYCVRLLEVGKDGTPEDRFSFLLGAFIAADLDMLKAHELLHEEMQVVISGNVAVAEAWRDALAQMSITALILTGDQIERALLVGLKHIVFQCYRRRKSEHPPN